MSAIRVSGNFLNTMANEIHQFNINAGWWTEEEKGWVYDLMGNGKNKKLGAMMVATKLCLSHSEISEALEGARKGLMDDHLPDRPAVEVEIADTIIRLLDLAGAMNLDVGGALAEKFEYNAVRADHKKENRDNAGGKLI